MQPRIERRRAQCCRWLLYLAIFLSACALARLATAVPMLETSPPLAFPSS